MVQGAVGVVEPASAVLGDGDDVLDPDAELSGQVDAGLDREAHARHQRLLLALDHVRRLVGGDADAVAGPVDELLAVPGLGDQPARGPVDLLAGDAGPDRVDPGLLRLRARSRGPRGSAPSARPTHTVRLVSEP